MFDKGLASRGNSNIVFTHERSHQNDVLSKIEYDKANIYKYEHIAYQIESTRYSRTTPSRNINVYDSYIKGTLYQSTYKPGVVNKLFNIFR